LKKYFPALPPNAIAKNLTPNTLKSTGMWAIGPKLVT
jgi:hypothetical protein